MGLYCTRQLVGVNRSERATLSAQNGLKITGERRSSRATSAVLSGELVVAEEAEEAAAAAVVVAVCGTVTI